MRTLAAVLAVVALALACWALVMASNHDDK
jgi:hypothetical protein